jgi:hypothetical protein
MFALSSLAASLHLKALPTLSFSSSLLVHSVLQTRLGVSVHANPTKQGHDNKLGVHLQIGFLPKKQVSNSPCLLHEPIFHN